MLDKKYNFAQVKLIRKQCANPNSHALLFYFYFPCIAKFWNFCGTKLWNMEINRINNSYLWYTKINSIKLMKFQSESVEKTLVTIDFFF